MAVFERRMLGLTCVGAIAAAVASLIGGWRKLHPPPPAPAWTIYDRGVGVGQVLGSGSIVLGNQWTGGLRVVTDPGSALRSGSPGDVWQQSTICSCPTDGGACACGGAK